MNRPTLLSLCAGLIPLLWLDARAQTTVAPTLVADLEAGSGNSSPMYLKAGPAGSGKLYFTTRRDVANMGSTSALRSTDGTAGGTVVHVVDNKELVTEAATGSTIFYQRVLGSNRFDYGAVPLTTVAALEGAQPTIVLTPQTPPAPPRTTALLNDRLLAPFLWDATTGVELVSMAPVGGTNTLVLDLEPGAPSSMDWHQTKGMGCVQGNTAYFAAQTSSNSGGLWTTDGTTAGTRQLSAVAYIGSGASITCTTTRIWFTGTVGVRDSEPWSVLNGVATRMGDLNPTPGEGSMPADFTAVGEKVFFSATNGVNGRELWVYDPKRGTPVMVKDLFTTGDAAPYQMNAIGTNLFFFAADGSKTGEKLYRSDGTAANTVACYSLPAKHKVISSAVCNNKLYYVTNNFTEGTSRIWRTDGTTAGTQEIKPAIAFNSNPAPGTQLVVVGNTVYFAATFTSAGRELWKITEATKPRL